MKVIQALKWKAFTLAVANTDDDTDDDIQNLAKKLTAAAIDKGLCVIIHDNDDDGKCIKDTNLINCSNNYIFE